MNAFTLSQFVPGPHGQFGLASSVILGTLNMPDVQFTSSHDTFVSGPALTALEFLVTEVGHLPRPKPCTWTLENIWDLDLPAPSKESNQKVNYV